MTLTASTRESPSKLPPPFLFCILGAISLLIWWTPLVSTFALAWRDSQHTHILLILPVSIALMYMDWESPRASGSASSVGFVFLIAAAVTKVVATLHIFPLLPDERLSVNMLALVVWWIGAFTLSFGGRALRRALFPLCFLFWIVPIPQFLLDAIVRLLQEGSVTSARLLFALAGVPSAQDATQITIPGLTVEVAAECSSIRSSLMLVVTTMVLAQILLRSTWRKILVIAVAIPLSVAKNGLRIFVLAMLTTRVDPSFIRGRLHHQGGIIYFLIALVGIGMLIWIARRGEAKPARALAMATSADTATQ
jgi:exosortase